MEFGCCCRQGISNWASFRCRALALIRIYWVKWEGKCQKMLYILGYKSLFGQAHGHLWSWTFLVRILSLFKAGMFVLSHIVVRGKNFTSREGCCGWDKTKPLSLFTVFPASTHFWLIGWLCLHPYSLTTDRQFVDIVQLSPVNISIWITGENFNCLLHSYYWKCYQQLGMVQRLMIFSVSFNEWLFKRGFTECAMVVRKACFTGGVVELTHCQGMVTKILMEITLL